MKYFLWSFSSFTEVAGWPNDHEILSMVILLFHWSGWMAEWSWNTFYGHSPLSLKWLDGRMIMKYFLWSFSSFTEVAGWPNDHEILSMVILLFHWSGWMAEWSWNTFYCHSPLSLKWLDGWMIMKYFLWSFSSFTEVAGWPNDHEILSIVILLFHWSGWMAEWSWNTFYCHSPLSLKWLDGRMIMKYFLLSFSSFTEVAGWPNDHEILSMVILLFHWSGWMAEWSWNTFYCHSPLSLKWLDGRMIMKYFLWSFSSFTEVAGWPNDHEILSIVILLFHWSGWMAEWSWNTFYCHSPLSLKWLDGWMIMKYFLLSFSSFTEVAGLPNDHEILSMAFSSFTEVAGLPNDHEILSMVILLFHWSGWIAEWSWNTFYGHSPLSLKWPDCRMIMKYFLWSFSSFTEVAGLPNGHEILSMVILLFHWSGRMAKWSWNTFYGHSPLSLKWPYGRMVMKYFLWHSPLSLKWPYGRMVMKYFLCHSPLSLKWPDGRMVMKYFLWHSPLSLKWPYGQMVMKYFLWHSPLSLKWPYGQMVMKYFLCHSPLSLKWLMAKWSWNTFYGILLFHWSGRMAKWPWNTFCGHSPLSLKWSDGRMIMKYFLWSFSSFTGARVAEWLVLLRRNFAGCEIQLMTTAFDCTELFSVTLPPSQYDLNNAEWDVKHQIIIIILLLLWLRKPVVNYWQKYVNTVMHIPTGDQEVVGLTPAVSAAFFRGDGDWSWNIFYGHSLPSADSRRAVVSFWQKNVAQYWLTA